jgi:hypothetical protein
MCCLPFVLIECQEDTAAFPPRPIVMTNKIKTGRKGSLLNWLADALRSRLIVSASTPSNVEPAADSPGVGEPKSRVLAGKWPRANQLQQDLGRRA